MKNNKTIDLKNYTVPAGKVLVMKQVSPKNTAYNGFEWPDLGFVECEKWEAKEECGNGLHGFLKGAGNGSLADYDKDAIWKLCEVEENGIIDLKGKVKFKNAEVIFSGCLKDVADIMSKLYPNTCVIGCTATAGDSGTATAGDSGTATAGDSGVLIITYYDNAKSQYLRKVALVGYNGILHNVKYRINDNYEFEKVS